MFEETEPERKLHTIITKTEKTIDKIVAYLLEPETNPKVEITDLEQVKIFTVKLREFSLNFKQEKETLFHIFKENLLSFLKKKKELCNLLEEEKSKEWGDGCFYIIELLKEYLDNIEGRYILYQERIAHCGWMIKNLQRQIQSFQKKIRDHERDIDFLNQRLKEQSSEEVEESK